MLYPTENCRKFIMIGGALEPYSCYSKSLAYYRVYFQNFRAFEGMFKIQAQRLQRIFVDIKLSV